MNHTINAAGKKLGRVASEAASLLRGKLSPDFERNVLPTLSVTIENAGMLSLTEKKQQEKKYRRYSGYPSGQKEESLARLLTRRGVGVAVRRAVYGMLPKNKLRARAIKNLIVKK